MNPVIFLILFILAIVFSAIFSGFEIAYISLPKGKIGIYFRGRLERFLSKYPERVLTADLIGNNLSNVTAAITLTEYMLSMGKSLETAVGTAGIVVTLFILIFGEILPKSFSRTHSVLIVRSFAYLLFGIYILSLPIVKIFETLLYRTILARDGRRKRGREELELLILRGQEEGILRTGEGRLLRGALHFYEITAGEIMKPRNEIFALPVDLSPDEFWKEARKSPTLRIPVYRSNLDNIVGIVHIKDLFLALEKRLEIRQIIRPIAFSYRDWSLDKVLREIRKRGTTVSVVVDEYGGTAGILTLGAILEALLNALEYEKEFEAEEGVILPGDIKIDYLRKRGIELPETEKETVAGLILERMGRIPVKGEVIVIGRYRFEIVDSDEKEIHRVFMREVE
jgi:putative hemolysin